MFWQASRKCKTKCMRFTDPQYQLRSDASAHANLYENMFLLQKTIKELYTKRTSRQRCTQTSAIWCFAQALNCLTQTSVLENPPPTIHNKSNKQHSIHLFYHKIYTTAVAFTLRRRRIVSIITTAHAYKYIPCIHILHYHIQRPPYQPSQLAWLMILLSKYETLR